MRMESSSNVLPYRYGHAVLSRKKQNFISMLISKSETYLLDDHEHGMFFPLKEFAKIMLMKVSQRKAVKINVNSDKI